MTVYRCTSSEEKYKWLEIRGSTPRQALREHLNEEYWVWDCDGGSTHYYYFWLKDDQAISIFFEVEHEYWESRGDEGFTVENQFTIKSCDKSDTTDLHEERDWLIITY